MTKKSYGEKRNTFRRQLVRYRLTGQKGGRREKNNARSQSMALPTTPLLALSKRALKYKNLQGAIGKPLEASYRHLQGQPFHDYLLKFGVLSLIDYSK
jgi:hypothetical protein